MVSCTDLAGIQIRTYIHTQIYKVQRNGRVAIYCILLGLSGFQLWRSLTCVQPLNFFSVLNCKKNIKGSVLIKTFSSLVHLDEILNSKRINSNISF